MKVLFVAQGYPGVPGTSHGSGIGTYLRELTAGLTEQGHECHVLAWALPKRGVSRDKCQGASSGLGATESVDGVTVHLLEHAYLPVIERFAPESRDAFNLQKLVRRLHGEYSFDWIEIQNEEGIAIGVQRDFPDKSILRIHTDLQQMVEYKQVPITWAVRWRLRRERKSFNIARRIWITSECHKRELDSQYGIGGKTKVVGIGIDLPENIQHPTSNIQRPTKAEERNTPVFLVVGTADRRKGFDRIRPVLEAYAAKHGPCRALVVSECDGAARESFGLIPPFAEGVEIEWRHGIGRKELFNEYAGASALFHPARYESFGLPLIEAAAMRLPVVATGTGVAPELLEGDLARFIIDADDPGACANALAEAVTAREDVGARLHERYEQAYTRDKMVEGYLAALGLCVKRKVRHAARNG